MSEKTHLFRICPICGVTIAAGINTPEVRASMAARFGEIKEANFEDGMAAFEVGVDCGHSNEESLVKMIRELQKENEDLKGKVGIFKEMRLND